MYKAAKGGILGHADNVAETPADHLAGGVVVVGALRALADAEGFDHAACGSFVGSGGVDVGLGSTGHDDSVGVPFGRGNGARRVGPLERHTRHDLLALPDLTGAGIIGVCRHACKVGGEECLAIGTERNAVVCLGAPR